MVNIAIVDDNLSFLSLINKKLLYLDNQLQIKCFQNPNEFIKEINNFEYVLLDIDLPQIDGITLSKQLRKNNILIFFITVHKELMIKAFGKNVEGFILKDNLDEGIKDFLQFISDASDKYIKIVVNHKEIKICNDDILYIKYVLRDIEYHLINNKIITQKNINLKNVYSSLNDDFVLINRNTIVNLKYVESFKNKFISINNIKFPVSRRKIKIIKIKLIERLLGNDF